MIERCERSVAYSEGLSRAEFGARGLSYDALVRNIELLGEAARHIPEEERRRHVAIDWRSIIAIRNILVHGYLGIDDDILWDVVRVRVPELKAQLSAFRQAPLEIASLASLLTIRETRRRRCGDLSTNP